MPNVQFCIKLLQEIGGGGQGSLNSLSGGSSRNRENRSHRNRQKGYLRRSGREIPKSRQEAFLANAGALPAMV